MIKEVHFSIDDVSDVLRWIARNEPVSIFDTRFFGQLREWHVRYGIKVSLYYYFQKNGFCILELQDKYWIEITNNEAWMLFGFHAVSPEIFDIESFKDAFLKVEDKFRTISSNYDQAKILRLHNWQATEEMVVFLKKRGLKELLTADDDRVSYNLTICESNILTQKQQIIKKDILYRKTTFRVENIENIEDLIGLTIEKKDKVSRFVIFTHEWCWEKNKDKTEEIMLYFYDNNYSYFM